MGNILITLTIQPICGRIGPLSGRKLSRLVSKDYPIQSAGWPELEADGVVVTYSDGTTACYVVEKPLELGPHREPIETAHSKK
jgi:hypothetical protein